MTQETVKRGPGRPASFDVPTVAFLNKLPLSTVESVRRLAEQRDQPINVVVNTLLERGIRDASRSRKS